MSLTTPLAALRYALNHGTFGLDSLGVLHDALARFETDEAINMELVCAARQHARESWRRNRVEDAALWGDPPPGSDDEDTTGLGDRGEEGDDPDARMLSISHSL